MLMDELTIEAVQLTIEAVQTAASALFFLIETKLKFPNDV